MTCACDDLDLGPNEEANSVLIAEAQSRATSPGLPGICTIEPYHDGATTEQKKCHARRTLLMLSRWLYCSTQPNPSSCFAGECDDYANDVDSCYPA